MFKRTRHATVTLALLSTMLAAGSATAQDKADRYPSRPVRLIVPFAPGGGTDLLARVIAQKTGEALGQSVVIDNRAGGGGTIGTEIAARATPDGYTLCMVSTSYSTNGAMFRLPYDPVNDITPISLVGESGILVTLHPSVPARSIKELIALAKAKPDSLNYASTGTGGNTHLISELFNLMAGTKMTHVPYKGTGPALNDLLGGQVHLIFGTLPVMMPHVKTGRLRGIAVTNARRNSALPDMPTVAETLPGYEAPLWYGAWGPKGLPAQVVALWHAEIRKAMQLPEVRERFAADGLDPVDGPPELLREVVARDIAKWTKVIRAANIKPIQ